MKIALSAGLAAVFGLALAATPAGASNEDATAFQVNAAHDGNVHFKSFNPKLKLKWSRNLGGDVSYPLIVNGVVYVTSVTNPGGNYGTTLTAMDLHTGDILWQQPIAGTYYISNAAYDQGKIFVLNFDGQMRAFDAKTGTPGFDVDMDSGFDFGPPVAEHGKLYAAENSLLFSLNEGDGSQLWAKSSGAQNAAVIAGKDVFSTVEPGHFKYNDKGKLLWEQNTGSQSGSAAYYKGRLYSRGGAVLDGATGNIVMTLEEIDYAAAFWSDNDGNSFRLGVSGGELTSDNVQDGTTAWSFGDGRIITAPIVVNDLVVVGSSDGVLYVLDAATGAVKSSQTVAAGISGASEYCCTNPWTGMSAGDGAVAVPGGDSISVFMPVKKK